MPLILARRIQRQRLSEFEANLVYREFQDSQGYPGNPCLRKTIKMGGGGESQGSARNILSQICGEAQEVGVLSLSYIYPPFSTHWRSNPQSFMYVRQVLYNLIIATFPEKV